MVNDTRVISARLSGRRAPRGGQGAGAGIERRAAHVYGQRWLRGVQVVRPLLPALLAHAPAADLRRAEEALRTAGPAATGAVGAGGAADSSRG